MKADRVFRKVTKEGRRHLLETEAKQVCEDYGIPVTKFRLAKSKSEARKFATEIGYPIVLKIVSPDIIHKSDVGGVMIDLQNPEDLEKAFNQIMKNVGKYKPEAKITGMLVQEMAPPSTEIIIGAINDQQFGPTLMFGLGGVFVEILKDVAFRIAPVTEQEAKEMVTEVKAYPILEGYRNAPRADIDAIIRALMNTSRLVTEHQEIKELDLNPIMVYEDHIKTVDARIILG